jgi:primase-polymerase (primpol)-like protein
MHFSAGNAYLRLPEPLRDCAQWVLADPRPHPTLYKEPYYVVNGTLRKADVNLPQTWHTFEEACAHAQTHNMLLGYVLKCGEGVTCIDLDFKDSNSHPDQPEVWTTQEQLNRYNVIIQHFDSYTERSRSGRGVHIWVLGEIGAGVKYDGVEVYSQSRYIICTANAIIQKEAVYRQELLDVLVSEMRVHSHSTGKVALVELEQTESDETIISRATSAENKDKFLKLANGDWQGDYASQSEADYAFMSMLTFYSKSNEQCRRLFRLSALGKRDKATRNDRYLNECLINIRSREAVEQEQQEVIRNTAKHVSANIVQNLVRRRIIIHNLVKNV